MEKDLILKKRYKIASDYLLVIGIAHLLLFVLFFGTYISFIYLIIGIPFLILYRKVKKNDNKALKIGVILYSLIILADGIYLIWNYRLVLLILLLLKFTVLLYLVNPFREPKKEEIWEKGISRLPYVLPVITIVPFALVFYVVYLATDNIFYSILSYIPPILFLLIWFWIAKKRRSKL